MTSSGSTIISATEVALDRCRLLSGRREALVVDRGDPYEGVRNVVHPNPWVHGEGCLDAGPSTKETGQGMEVCVVACSSRSTIVSTLRPPRSSEVRTGRPSTASGSSIGGESTARSTSVCLVPKVHDVPAERQVAAGALDSPAMTSGGSDKRFGECIHRSRIGSGAGRHERVEISCLTGDDSAKDERRAAASVYPTASGRPNKTSAT